MKDFYKYARLYDIYNNWARNWWYFGNYIDAYADKMDPRLVSLLNANKAVKSLIAVDPRGSASMVGVAMAHYADVPNDFKYGQDAALKYYDDVIHKIDNVNDFKRIIINIESSCALSYDVKNELFDSLSNTYGSAVSWAHISMLLSILGNDDFDYLNAYGTLVRIDMEQRSLSKKARSTKPLRGDARWIPTGMDYYVHGIESLMDEHKQIPDRILIEDWTSGMSRHACNDEAQWNAWGAEPLNYRSGCSVRSLIDC